MPMSPQLEYNNLLQAVGDYYGVGSDQWYAIATNGAGVTPQEWASILKQTPNVDVWLNENGEVVSYSVMNKWGTATDGVTSAINSNAQAATLEGASEIGIPANTTINTTTGKVAAESGMKKVATGNTATTIVKDVALGVAAVGVGMRAGAAFDSALYNLDPDFFNSIGWGNMNPYYWDEICTTKAGKKVFNMVFGIDKTTQQTQAYIDQNAFAYIVQYLSSLGAFDFEPSASIDDTTGLTMGDLQLPFNCLSGSTGYSYKNGNYNYSGNVVVGSAYLAAFLGKYVSSGQTYYDVHFIFGSKDPFTVSINSAGYQYTANANQATINGNTFYYYRTLGGGGGANTFVLNTSPYNDYTYLNRQIQIDAPTVGYILAYGNVTTGGGVTGITQQTGATVPTGITPTMTIPEVLTALQTLYPTLFDDAIYNDVLQDDGTVKRYIYLPTGIPENVTVSPEGYVQPTGGTTITQDDTIIDPTIIPDSIIDQLLKIITSTDPYNPTTNPPDTTTDYPDTGNGSTPAVVLPTGSASALYSIYNPTQAQLNSLGAWLWSSNFVDQLLKLFNDPMQAIIGLHKVFATPPTSGTGTIKVGYLDSGVGANLVSAQYTEVDCGTVQLKEYFGNSLDYVKTDVYLYLPFVGIVPLNVEDVTRAIIGVKYKVDVLTGACLASVNVTRDLNAGGQLYVYAGNCAVQYPLSSGSYMGIVAGALGIAGSVASSVLSGGALLPMALGAGVSAMGNMKTKVEHSGSLSGNSGAMGIKKPYLIIRRPQTKIANNFQLIAGESQNEYGVLSSYTGQTRVKYVHLENIPATDNELTQIEELLKSGVLI